MTAIKRVDDVLLAFRGLRERGVDATLCLVGDGPDKEDVERAAHELEIARHVLFVGYQRQVSEYYGLFDALLLPSANERARRWSRSSPSRPRGPSSPRGSGACRTSSRRARAGSSSRSATWPGWPTPSNASHGPELRSRLGEAGRSRVLSRYRVERLVDDVDDLYRELLSEAGLPAPVPRTPRTPVSASPRG